MSGPVLASAGWDIWGALAAGGVAVALLLGFALAAGGLRRAVWATAAVAAAAGFASAFPLLFPDVTPEPVLPYTVWPRLGYAAAAVACALWALVMLPGGAARTAGGVWTCRGVGVAAAGAGWWAASRAFGDQLPEEIASALADPRVPFGCVVLAPLCLAVAAWFNPCRRAPGRWLTRAVAVAAVGGAGVAAVELFGAELPAEVTRAVSWREIAVGTGAGVGSCLLVAAVAALRRKPVAEHVAGAPAVASPVNVPPKPPPTPPVPKRVALLPVPAAAEFPEGRAADESESFALEFLTDSPVPRPSVAQPAVTRPETKPDVPDAGCPFSRFIPQPVPKEPPRSRMDLVRSPVTPPAEALEPTPAPPPDET